MHIVQTPFGIRRLCDIHIIILIENCKRTIDGLRLTYLYRWLVAQIQMLQHFTAIFICGQFKNIKRILFPITSPVILRGLKRRIHLINPGCRQCRVPATGCKHAAASVKTTCFTVILSCDISGSLRTGQCRKHHIIGIVVNICNIPGKAETVTVIFTFCHIGWPLLRKCLRVYKILCYQLMQPFDAFFITFLHGRINHGSVIFYGKMIARISISFAKSVDENRRILIAIVDDKWHRNHISLDIKLFF